MNITIEEAKIIKAALVAFAAEGRSDEPHWSYQDDFKALMRKVKDFLDIENNRKTLEGGLKK